MFLGLALHQPMGESLFSPRSIFSRIPGNTEHQQAAKPLTRQQETHRRFGRVAMAPAGDGAGAAGSIEWNCGDPTGGGPRQRGLPLSREGHMVPCLGKGKQLNGIVASEVGTSVMAQGISEAAALALLNAAVVSFDHA